MEVIDRKIEPSERPENRQAPGAARTFEIGARSEAATRMTDFGRANSLYDLLTDDGMMKLGQARHSATESSLRKKRECLNLNMRIVRLAALSFRHSAKEKSDQQEDNSKHSNLQPINFDFDSDAWLI